MKNIAILIVFLTFSLNSVFTQENNKGGIIYGQNFAFIVTAPVGWIMDSDSMSQQGIFGLFYEEGKIFGAQNNTPIIYIVTFALNNASDDELIKFAQEDINKYVINGAKTERINRRYKKSDILYLTYNVNLTNGRYETFVFMRYKNTCLIVILNANNNAQRNELLPKLEEVINSISFMDKNP
jgi:hypothetical protein